MSGHHHHHRSRHLSQATDRHGTPGRHGRGPGSASGLAPSSGDAPAHARHPSSAARRHTSVRDLTPPGRQPSLYCLVLSILGMGAAVIAEVVSRSTGHPTLPFLNACAGFAALASLGSGGYAIFTLARRDSRRVKRRTVIGLPVSVCTVLVVVSNLLERRREPAVVAEQPVKTQPVASVSAAPTDVGLVKPGWFGELITDGLAVVVNSYEENAAESRRFNRQLSAPVAFATVTLCNRSASHRLELHPFETRAQLDDGSTAACLGHRTLVAHCVRSEGGASPAFAERLEVAPGATASDIPICMNACFAWERVTAVSLLLDGHPTIVEGRYLTAADKLDGLLQPASAKP